MEVLKVSSFSPEAAQKEVIYFFFKVHVFTSRESMCAKGNERN